MRGGHPVALPSVMEDERLNMLEQKHARGRERTTGEISGQRCCGRKVDTLALPTAWCDDWLNMLERKYT